MSKIRDIALDPRKSLSDLEKKLGAAPGDLLRDMERLGPPGEDWSKHLPYRVAVSYYDDEKSRSDYEKHVDGCDYCKSLLDTLHPADIQTAAFLERVRASQSKRRMPYSTPVLALAASIAMLAIGIGVFPLIQQEVRDGARTSASTSPGTSTSTSTSANTSATTNAPADEVVVTALRMDPDKLVRLQASNDPAQRYEAAKWYFGLKQSQLAYQQIGEGLELSGVPADDARMITTAAYVPSSKSAETIEDAVLQLAKIDEKMGKEPSDYLLTARLQAKLGLHGEAMKSIEQYLRATKTDPKVVTEFSHTAMNLDYTPN